MPLASPWGKGFVIPLWTEALRSLHGCVHVTNHSLRTSLSACTTLYNTGHFEFCPHLPDLPSAHGVIAHYLLLEILFPLLTSNTDFFLTSVLMSQIISGALPSLSLKYHFSSGFSVAMIQHHDQQQLEEVRVHLAYRLQSIIEASQGRNSRKVLEAKTTEDCCSLACLLQVSLSATLLTQPRPTCIRWCHSQ